MVWPGMDCHAKKELVIDQLLMAMNKHVRFRWKPTEITEFRTC